LENLSGLLLPAIDLKLNNIQSIYLNHPTREYRYAFDLVAGWFNRSDCGNLCLLSSNMFAVELIKRCPHQLDLIGTNGFDAADFISSSVGWNWGKLNVGVIDGSVEDYKTIIWIDPDASQLDITSRQLNRIAMSNTRLFVIMPGLLHRVLPVPKSYPQNNNKLLPYSLARCLSNTGWQIESTLGLHGPHSIAWGWMYQLCTLISRNDWADKSLFAIRDSYQETGWLWWLSPLTIICAVVI